MRNFTAKILAGFLALFPTFSMAETKVEFPTKSVVLITEAPTTAKETTVVKGDRYIIKGDPGGSVSEFVQSLMYAKNKGMKFKIDGYCASACTLILAKPLKLDVCVTKNASFMFHQPFAMSGNDVYYSIPYIVASQTMWDNLFYSNYPDWVKKLIDANGGVPNVYTGAKISDMFVVKYGDIKLPTCDEVPVA